MESVVDTAKQYIRHIQPTATIIVSLTLIVTLLLYSQIAVYIPSPVLLSTGNTIECKWVFSHYISSPYELEWIDGINNKQWWDDNICQLMTTTPHWTIAEKIVLRTRELMAQTNTVNKNDTLISTPYHKSDQYMSQMHYKYQCIDTDNHATVHRTGIQLIEPLFGYLRDPFDEWCNQHIDKQYQSNNIRAELNVGAATGQSKYHIVTGLYAPYTINDIYNRNDITHVPWYTNGIAPWYMQSVTLREPQTIVLDMGSAYFGTWRYAGNANSGQYLYNTIHQRGLSWSHFYAFEYSRIDPVKAYSQLPADIVHTYHLVNVGVSADPLVPLNPWNIIRHTARHGDYVAVKLDIDTPDIELPLIDQLIDANNTDIADLISEFYFEHHTDVLPMRDAYLINFPRGYRIPYTLIDSYRIFVQMRQRGIRAHSWP